MARGESRGHSAMGHAALQPFTLEWVGWRDIHARRSSSVVRHWPLVRHASASAVLGLDKLPTPHLLLRHRYQTKAPREGQVAGDPSVSDPFIQHSLALDTHPPAQLLASRIPHRASRVRHPASSIQHRLPASNVKACRPHPSKRRLTSMHRQCLRLCLCKRSEETMPGP